MEHQVPEWFLDWSKKSHWQASFPHAFTRSHDPSAMAATSVPIIPARKPSTPRVAGARCQLAESSTAGTNVDRRVARFMAATRSRRSGRPPLASASARIPSRTAIARRCESRVTFSRVSIAPASTSQSCSCWGVASSSVPDSRSLVLTNAWTRRSPGLGAGSRCSGVNEGEGAVVTPSGYHRSWAVDR